MSERFTAARGRKVVSRASAEEIGSVSHLVIDPERRVVAELVVGRGRGAQIVAFGDLSGFGADAVMVTGEDALREPHGDRDHAAVKGRLDAICRLALSDLGNELGHVSDIVFDPQTGVIETVLIGDDEHPGEALLGAGGYAVVLRVLPASA